MSEGSGTLVALASGPRRQNDFCPPLPARMATPLFWINNHNQVLCVILARALRPSE
jgi:hypothetical protein